MANKQVVLVVEDEPLVKDALVFELEDAGFEVVAAENGDEASNLLPKLRQIDLLLTDIRMPGRINGWDLADLARRRLPNLPVIYTSGYSPQRGLAVEDSIFLPKPYRIGEILDAIGELKARAEKLSSINDELAFANAELETAKEELELLNQELQTANAQLEARVRELTRASCNIADLLDEARIAMVFFDRGLAIKSFTSAAMDLFDLEESDVGRPISRIASRLRLDSLRQEAARVLDTLGACEKQIESADGSKRFMMRMLPYRTPRNAVAGVVINFIDVTRIAAAEAETFGVTRELRSRVDKMEKILDHLPAGVFIVGPDPTQNVQVNRYAVRLLGDDAAYNGPRDLPVPYRLFDRNRELAFWEQPLQQAALTGKAVPASPARLVRWDGSSVDVMMAAEPLLDDHGAPSGAIAAVIDLRDRRTAEAPADGAASSNRLGSLSRSPTD